jgi:hypothetical protein
VTLRFAGKQGEEPTGGFEDVMRNIVPMIRMIQDAFKVAFGVVSVCVMPD